MTQRPARRILKHVASFADRLSGPQQGVVILAYHRVGGGSRLEVDLAVETFDAQMAFLAASGRAITLDDAVALLTGEALPPAVDPVVVTFDDGTADLAEHALPVLVRHGVPATLYLATAFVEEQRSFPDDGPPLSWAALGDMVATGLVTVGSHTHNHAVLASLTPDQVAAELDRSVGLIGERLGVEAAHFAHPKAVAGDARGEAEVAKRFRSAALSGTRPNPYGRTDVHHLRRSPIQAADELRWFERKAAGGMALEGTLRQLVDRRRYSRSTT